MNVNRIFTNDNSSNGVNLKKDLSILNSSSSKIFNNNNSNSNNSTSRIKINYKFNYNSSNWN